MGWGWGACVELLRVLDVSLLLYYALLIGLRSAISCVMRIEIKPYMEVAKSNAERARSSFLWPGAN